MQVIEHSLAPAHPAGCTTFTSRLRKPRAAHLCQAAGLVLSLVLTACGGGGGGGSGGSSNTGSEGVARNTHCAR